MICNVCTKGYEAMAMRDSKGYYLGTRTSDGKPNCRLTKSFQYREEAQSLLDGKNVVHQMSTENAICSNGRPCFGLFEHDAGIFRHNIYFAGLDFSGQENYYYKSEAAFLAREGTCYIPEAYFGENKSLNAEDGRIFSYADLLEEVNGNKESCRWLFYNRLTWAIPNTDIEELDKIGLMMCNTCGAFVGIEEPHRCHDKAEDAANEDDIESIAFDTMVEILLPEDAFREVMGTVLTEEMDNDDESSADKMWRIVERYLAAEPPERDLIDDIVSTLCGWTVKSLLEKAVWQYTGIKPSKE